MVRDRVRRTFRALARGRSAPDAGGGQVLVLFALSLVVILAFAGLAFDVGRFYSERRFLQNAADAAALAAGTAIVEGQGTTTADAVARDVLTKNFAHDPNGPPPSLPPTTPVYADGHQGDPLYLVNGILITSGEIRVAVQNPVGYTFARAIGLTSATIGAQARVAWNGNALPIAVREFVHAPGPNTSPPTPCPAYMSDGSLFYDFFATGDTSCKGTDTDRSLRTDPSPGANFDPSNPGGDSSEHGPVVEILGVGADPNNGADFRGLVGLDIRNFATSTSQVYYNGVTSGTNPNTLKAMESSYLCGGYPGPALPPPTTPPDPNDQVSILSGNNTGPSILQQVANCHSPGDEVLVMVYPGNVMAIPDFTISPPSGIALPTSGTTANAGTFKVSRNQAFSGTVNLSTLADSLDPTNPLTANTLQKVNTNPDTSKSPDAVAYSPNPVTPSLGAGQNVTMSNLVTSGATAGIYTLWIEGQAGSPYLTTKFSPFPVAVGGVTGDFTISSDSASKSATNTGDSVTFTLTLQDASNHNTFGGPVSLSVDATSPYGALPSGIGAISFGSPSVTPTSHGASTTLTVNTGTLPQGTYTFVVRATGLNGDSPAHKVTHLLPLTIQVAPGGSSGSQSYVDILGFAVMRIVSVNTNTVSAYAITPLITDIGDARLHRGEVARLTAWGP